MKRVIVIAAQYRPIRNMKRETAPLEGDSPIKVIRPDGNDEVWKKILRFPFKYGFERALKDLTPAGRYPLKILGSLPLIGRQVIRIHHQDRAVIVVLSWRSPVGAPVPPSSGPPS